MSHYDIRMTLQARAVTIIALVGELERTRDKQPTDDLGKRARDDALTTLQDAIDALHGAQRVDEDRMPADAVERTVNRAREAFERFCAASDARREREVRP